SALRNTSSLCRSCSPYARSRVTSTLGSLPLARLAKSCVVAPSIAGVRSAPRLSSLARKSGFIGYSIHQQHRLERLARMGVVESAGDLGKRIESQQPVEREAALPPELDQLGNEQARMGIAAEDAAQLFAAGEHREHRRIPVAERRSDEPGGAVHRQAFERGTVRSGCVGGVEAEIDAATGQPPDP